MIKSIRILIPLLILTLGSISSYAQLTELQIRTIADSILHATAGGELIQNVHFSEFLLNDTDDLILNKNYKAEYTRIQITHPISEDTVIYWLRFKVGNSPMLVEEQNHFPDSAFFSMYFLQLEELYLASIPDYPLFEQYLTESKRSDFVKKEVAMDSAQVYFPRSLRAKKERNSWVYHEEDGRTYWVISKGKGMVEVMEYSVYIDAESGTFVRMINDTYSKKLLKVKTNQYER